MKKSLVWILLALPALYWVAERRQEGRARKGIIINEVLARNRFTNFDEDEQSSDWLEIYNASGRALNLDGYGLSDEPNNPHKWVFPRLALAPNDRLLVWCSGKDRREVGDDRSRPLLHTNFRLSRLGQTILVSSPDGEPLDALVVTPQTEDRSYGRSPDGRGDFVYYLLPSPMKPNSGPVTRETIPSRIEVDPPGGFFQNAVEIGLSARLPVRGVEIRYTRNGALPTPRSLLYEGPINLEPNERQPGVVVRAAAFWNSQRVTPVETHSYFFNAADYRLPIMSLAVVPAAFRAVHTNFRGRGKAREREAHLEIFNRSGTRTVASGIGLRLHGVGSRYGGLETKKSYRVYFRDMYGDKNLKGRVLPGAEADRFDRLVLRANTDDAFRNGDRASYIRDQLMRELHGDMGNLICHGGWYNLFVNMDYRGVFNVVERADRFFFRSYLQEDGDQWDVVNDGEAREGDLIAWHELRRFFSASDLSDNSLYEKATTLIDIGSYTDYMILNIWAQNHDWPHKNFLAARPRRPDAKWIFVCWDGEFGFGLYPPVYDADTFHRSLTRGGSPIGEIFVSLFRSPHYQSFFLKELEHQLENALHPDNVLERIGRLRYLVGTDLRKEIELTFPELGFDLWERNIREMESFARNRGQAIWSHVLRSAHFTVPRVASLSPSAVILDGRKELELEGYGFTAGTRVRCNQVSVPVVHRVVPHSLRVVLPVDPALEGTPDITVWNPDGGSTTWRGMLNVTSEGHNLE